MSQMIDWDLAARGDVALDVGNFLVYVRTRLGRLAPRATHGFLDGYVAERPATMRGRLPVYMALTYLRLACKYARLGDVGLRERAIASLRQADLCLMKDPEHVAA